MAKISNMTTSQVRDVTVLLCLIMDGRSKFDLIMSFHLTRQLGLDSQSLYLPSLVCSTNCDTVSLRTLQFRLVILLRTIATFSSNFSIFHCLPSDDYCNLCLFQSLV